MMASFKIQELLDAADGKLIQKGNADFVSGVSTDSRTIGEGELFIALRGDNFDGHDYVSKAVSRKAAAVMVSDLALLKEWGNFVTVICVKDTLSALFSLAYFHRMRFSVPVVGITGSNGKTTTKDMLSAVLSSVYKITSTQKNFNNEIGLSQTLLSMTGETEVCVTEMGMRGLGQINQLCSITSPTMGIVTNVGTSHIGILGSQENIALAKSELIRNLSEDGTAILNGDDPFVRRMGTLCNHVVYYGLGETCSVRGKDIVYDGESTCYTCVYLDKEYPVKLNLLGIHNVYDSLAAAAAGLSLGVDMDHIVEALKNFKPIGQRQTILNIHGVTVLDDSYNANPLSMEMAFSSLAQMNAEHRYLVLGDMGELGKFEKQLHFKTGAKAAQFSFDGLITVGPLCHELARGAKENGMENVFSFESCEDAAECLMDIVKPGDAVLVKGSHYMHMEEIPKIIDRSYIK